MWKELNNKQDLLKVNIVRLWYALLLKIKFNYNRFLRRTLVCDVRFTSIGQLFFPSTLQKGWSSIAFIKIKLTTSSFFYNSSFSENANLINIAEKRWTVFSSIISGRRIEVPDRLNAGFSNSSILAGRLGIGLLILFFSSCHLGKEYQRPQLDLPNQFNAVSYSDTNSIADIEWRQFFQHPELQQLITKGIDYNHDLLIAIKRIDIAQRRVAQSKFLQLPQVEGALSAQISRPSDNSLSGISLKNFIGTSYVENYSAGINVFWEADIWGKIRGQKGLALTEYLQTTEAAKAVQTRLVADIAQGFFNLMMLDKQLAIARKNLTVIDSFVVVTRLLKEAGIGNLLGVQQAESQKLSTALLIPQLEQSLALQENALQLLTGQLPTPITLNSSLNEFSVLDNLTTGLPAAMVSRRPDVREAELALVRANSLIGITQASMYPALNITVGGGLESFKSSNWFNIPSALFGIVAGSIAQPIFRRRELKTNFEIAKLEREEAVIVFRQSVLQAIGEVEVALVQTDKLKQQRQIATGQVELLHSAVFNAQLLFKSDMANYLEVLLAQANALQAELNLAFIERQQLDAMVELYRSLGGGWK